jgi:molybdopterin synthase sulfur carrier subunit
MAHVLLPTVLSPFAEGHRHLDAPGATLGAVVRELGTRYPSLTPRLVDASGAPYPFVTFYLNDEDIRFLGGFDAPVSDGDEVTIVPAVAGG